MPRGSVTSTGSTGYVGGILGYTPSNNYNTITCCCNYASVTGVNYVGGIAGNLYVYSATSAVHIESCYNRGNVKSTSTTTSSYAGGLVGYWNSASGKTGYIQNSYNTGTVTCNGTYSGLVGRNSSKTSYTAYEIVKNCWTIDTAGGDISAANVTLQDSSGNSLTLANASVQKTDAEMKNASFVTTLGSNFRKGTDYPTLTWEIPAGTPTITAQPAGFDYNLSTSTSSTGETTLSVTASYENDTMSYQWYSNTTDSTDGGTAIENATSATYTPPVTTVGTTYYYCVVTNSTQSTADQTLAATSDTARVRVYSGEAPTAPTVTIAASPENTTVNQGVSTTFTATVSDAPDGGGQTYQWQSKTSGASDFSNIEGATETTYTASNDTIGTTAYRCVATNWLGVESNTTSANSTEISITVQAYAISTADEFLAFATLVNNGTDDFDGKTVLLANDIDMTGKTMSAVGSNSNPFKGMFDG